MAFNMLINILNKLINTVKANQNFVSKIQNCSLLMNSAINIPKLTEYKEIATVKIDCDL